MRRPRQFAVCLDNSGNEASLFVGKIYAVIPDAKAAQDDLLRVIDESGEDYLFAQSQFAPVEFPQAVRRKLLALQRAGSQGAVADETRGQGEPGTERGSRLNARR